MRAKELLCFALLAFALALVLTWPLARELSAVLPHDPRFQPESGADMHIWVWDYWWARQVLETGAAPFYSQAIFAPQGHSLALHTHAFLWGLLSVPAQWWLGLPAALNLSVIALFVCSAVAAWALARELRLGAWGAALAALAWAFSPYFIQKSLEHLCYMASPWPPLLTLFLLRWWRCAEPKPRRRAALAAGLVGGLALLTEPVTSLYLGLFALALLLLRPASLEQQGAPVPRLSLALRDPVAWLLAFGAALLLGAPWWLAAWRDWRAIGELPPELAAWGREQLYHPRLLDFLVWPGLHPWGTGLGSAAPDAAIQGALAGVPRPENAGLHLSWMLLLLVALAALRARGVWRWILLASSFGLLCWDPGPQPVGWLAGCYRSWPALDVLRVPARAFPFLHLPLCLLGGLGLELLLTRVVLQYGRLAQRLLGALVVCAALWPAWIGSYPTMPWRVPQAVEALAARPGGTVAVLPFLPGAYASMSWQSVHQRPVLISYVARTNPTLLLQLKHTLPDLFDLSLGLRLPDPEALALDLQHAGVTDLLVPSWELQDPEALFRLLDALDGWERVQVQDGLEWWHRARGGEGLEAR